MTTQNELIELYLNDETKLLHGLSESEFPEF